MCRYNRGLFIIILILFFISLFLGGYYFYGILLAVAFLIIISYLMGESVFKNLVCMVWRMHESVVVGDKIKISLQLYNAGIVPIPYILVKMNLPKKLTGEDEKKLVASIMPGKKLIFDTIVTCCHKGVYGIGNVAIEYSDVFGLFTWIKQFNEDTNLIVYPNIPQLEYFNIPVRQHFGTIPVRNKAYEDFSSVRDIRKYSEGDSLKRVHWKVTAHRNELYIKNLELNASANINIFLDYYRENFNRDDSIEYEEKACECALAIIKYSLFQGMPVSFCTAVNQIINISGKGINKFQEFLDITTRLTPCGTMPICDLIRKEMQKQSIDTTAVIITTNIDDSFIDIIYTMKISGLFAAVIYVGDMESQKKNWERLQASGIAAFKVGINEDIPLILGGRHEN